MPITHHAVKSSNIESVGYDPATLHLEVRFASGKTYTYAKVEQRVFDSLRSADSVGSYFHQHIRNKYAVVS